MKNLSSQAKLLILGTVLVGALLTSLQLPLLDGEKIWFWLSLSGLAAMAHILKVEGATAKTSYQVSFIIYGFTLILLGAPAAIFVTLIAHLVEWAWHKYPWYIQTFNIATFVISFSIAGAVYAWIDPDLALLSLRGATAILVAMAVFTFINHLMVGLVVQFARGESFSQSGVFGKLTLMIDYAMLCMGAVAAIIWTVNPYATVITLVPLYLIYSTLKVPALERQTQIDAKTGLYNARYFAGALEIELARADRFDRPLTIVMADLDLLRNINNTYGHLAGDQVLIGIADILRNSFRDYDIVARFGGEEFAILMPETTAEQAYPRAESIRKAVEEADFNVPTSVTPIKATLSLGISERDKFGLTPSDIIHNADMALYHAKLEGRNQTAVYSGDSLEGLFSTSMPGVPVKDEAEFRARLEVSDKPYEPPPLRSAGGEEPASRSPTTKPRPAWLVNVYIGCLAFLAAISIGFALTWEFPRDWTGLGVFALVVLLTEGLSIEIYAKDTSVSTAAAPMASGMLLFGPPGVLVLSLIQAATALIKHRSPYGRFVFNLSNQVLAGLLGILPVFFLASPVRDLPMLHGLALVLFASGVGYLVSTALVSGAISLDSGYPTSFIWTERFRWLAPYYLALGVVAFALLHSYLNAGIAGVLVLLVPLLMLRFSQVQYIDHTKTMVKQLRTKNDDLETSAREIVTLNEELLVALSQVIDLRDPYVLGHSQRVAGFAVEIAEKMGLPAERVELIRKAALLHDIGKLGVRESILFKPAKLTESEYHSVQLHTILGADVVQNCHSLRKLVPIIRHHHERYDGQGYPNGLKGQQIPIEARILGLADAAEAMASHRSYRNALSGQEIIEEVKNNAGTQFDPNVAKAFLEILHDKGTVILEGRTAQTPGEAEPARKPSLVEPTSKINLTRPDPIR